MRSVTINHFTKDELKTHVLFDPYELEKGLLSDSLDDYVIENDEMAAMVKKLEALLLRFKVWKSYSESNLSVSRGVLADA